MTDRRSFQPRDITLRDGRIFRLRPINAADGPLLRDMIDRSAPEDIRLRFFAPMRSLTEEAAERLSKVDPASGMALVVEAPEGGRNAILAVGRFAIGPAADEAEYAVMVRSDLKGQGLGYLLMREIIAHARVHRLRRLYGEVLRENATMLRMAGELGFQRRDDPDDPGLVRVIVDLTENAA